MSRKTRSVATVTRRQFTEDFKRQAVQMLLDRHSASSIVERLGMSGTNLLYRWKRQQIDQAGPVGDALDNRLHSSIGYLTPSQFETTTIYKT